MPRNHARAISPRLFALIPVAVAINLVIGRIVQELSLPVYLDTVGTTVVAILTGVWGGVIVGTITNILAALLGGGFWLAFTPIQWLIAIIAALAARQRGFATPIRAGAWGVGCGIACGSASAVISWLYFGGVTSPGTGAVMTALMSTGMSQQAAITASSVSTDIVDKLVSFLLVAALLRGLPRRILGRFPIAARAIAR